jgi:hypothetical protein
MPSRLSRISVLTTKFRSAISPSRESFEHDEATVFDVSRNPIIPPLPRKPSSTGIHKMSLTILTDQNVKDILQSLDREELLGLQSSMRLALHEYATGTNSSGAAAANQPNRTVIESSNGTTTLFMPSTSSSGIGMKGTYIESRNNSYSASLNHILTIFLPL